MRISKEYEFAEFTEVIVGAEKMPHHFIDEIMSTINAHYFAKKLGTNETEIERQIAINEVWNHVRESNNEYLISTFVEKALSSKKTGEETAYKILFWLAKNKSDVYKSMIDQEVGTSLYCKSVIRALNNYYKYGIKKEIENYIDNETLYYNLHQMCM